MEPSKAPRGRTALVRQALVSMVLLFAVGMAWAVLSEPATAQDGSGQIVTDDVMLAAAASDGAAASSDGAIAPRVHTKIERKAAPDSLGAWIERFSPILILLAVIVFVLVRLPRVELGHSDAFRRRRVINWLPLGLTYAFLYMGRYNLNVAKISLGDLMSLADFAMYFGIGTVVYGVSFVVNGPLTDRIGGRKAILIGATGSMLANIGLGVATAVGIANAAELKAAGEEASLDMTAIFAVLYAVNMYFQSFGAVAIVKVNAPWFHVRERGVFGAIFGILISLGVYFAYDWSAIIVSLAPIPWVFFAPAVMLAIFIVLDLFFVRDTPGQAGFTDFDTGDASSGDTGPRLPVREVFKKMLSSKVIMIIASIEFCSGYLRQAIMQLYLPYADAIADPDDLIIWVSQNWGLLLCAAGILGGTVAGVISDRIFDSRRGPVAAFLYGLMFVGAVVGIALVGTPFMGLLVVVLSLFVIGVHGMLSGTASMDFGGKRNVGVAVGIIDGFVYLGTGTMSLVYGLILPGAEIDPATGQRADLDPANWTVWPIAMIPLALVGLLLATRIWNSKPQPKGASAH